MNWYIAVMRKYAVFRGRAHRREFWMFVLINVLIHIAIGIIDLAIDSQDISYIYSLLVLVPSLAVGARRLHDTDHTGWWQLIGLIPVIGIIILIILWAQDGNRGPNKYGPDPKIDLQSQVAY